MGPTNDWDVPFGAREEENKLVRPVLIGLVAVVAVLLGIGAMTLLGGGSVSPSFTVSTQDEYSGGDDSLSVSSDAQSELVYVHVLGCVANPGVYGVTKGARLVEAIAEAGGFTPDAAQDALNLAREVVDGEQVRVYSQEEVAAAAEASARAADAAAAESSDSASSSSATASGKVNINTATSAELQTVSGIGPSTAEKIISERTKNGSFSSVDDLTRVSGIGEKKLEALRDYLTV